MGVYVCLFPPFETDMESLEAVNPDSVPDWKIFVQRDILRPVRLLFTGLIVLAVSAMGGTAVAIIYLFTEALLHIYEAMGINKKQSSLPFLAIGLAFMLNVPGNPLQERSSSATRIQVERTDFCGLRSSSISVVVCLEILPGSDLSWIVSVIALLGVGYGRNELAIVLTPRSVPFLFQRHGRSIRKRSKFAQYSMKISKETTVEKDGTS